MDHVFRLGELVISTRGRDNGRYYLIVEIEDKRHVKLSDGDKKKIEYPKRKNIKHLQTTGYIVEEIGLRLSEGKRIRNEDLKKIIKDYQKDEEGN